MPRPFTELGKLPDQLARSRDVRVRARGRSTEHVRENIGGGPGRSAWGSLSTGT